MERTKDIKRKDNRGYWRVQQKGGLQMSGYILIWSYKG